MAATVLLCDGAAFVRDLFGDALEGAGWTVVARAGTGEAALAALRTHRPRVAVLDVVLPDRDGLALIEAIRIAAPDTAVVICTGVGDVAVRTACAEAGAALILPKPLAPARLIEALRAFAR
jgi:two-component system chemotaxis response regulator CheY